MTDKDFWEEIMEIRYEHNTSMPNHFCKSIERLCEKQKMEVKNMNEGIIDKERIEELEKDKQILVKALEIASINTDLACPCFYEEDGQSIINEEEYGCKGCDEDQAKSTKCWMKTFISEAEKELNRKISQFDYIQNQKAVDALQKVREHIMQDVNHKDELERRGDLSEYGKGGASRNIIIIAYIDQLIKEYGGKDE